LQDVTARLDKAFQAFFRRVKAGVDPKKVGFPRFKGKYRYNSFTLSQAGWKLDALDSGRLYVAGIGHLKIKWSRPIAGTIKTVTIKRDADHWYVTFSYDVDIEPVSVADKPAVGIDTGLEYYATLSNGEHIENPRYYRKARATIARRQRALAEEETRQAQGRDVRAERGERQSGSEQEYPGCRLGPIHLYTQQQSGRSWLSDCKGEPSGHKPTL